VTRLRDLLKFEFYFPEREAFRVQIADELALMDREWEARLAAGEGRALLSTAPLLRAHWAVLPFLEAYQVVADQLLASPEPYDEKVFLAACLERGRRYLLERRTGADESVSQVLFKSAADLARNRGLLDARLEARREWADEISEIRSRAEVVANLA
jgi:glycerol-3-phosphate O-acyltransferase